MPDLQAQLRLLLVSHDALILAFAAVNASQKAVWRNSATAQKALLCFSVIRACRAVVRLLPNEGRCFVGKNWTEKSNGKSKDWIETSAFIRDRGMGLLAEGRGSLARGDSGREIILVRFDRLRAGWKSAGGREDFARTLSRNGRWEWKGDCVCLRL